jgi:hypothetical protein
MTATFQTEIAEKGYNGWSNYQTWNVALWIGNDEGLYDLAHTISDYDELVDVLFMEYGVKETRDGVKWNDPKINRCELNELLEDFCYA